MAMSGLSSATSAKMRRGLPTAQSSLECKDICQRSTVEGNYAPRLPVGAFFSFLGKFGKSLWISLVLLLLVPLSGAVETTGIGAEPSCLSVVWSIMILMILAFGLFIFGGLLIYCLDLLSEVLIFWTGLYDLLYGLVCEGVGLDEAFVRQAVYSTWGLLIKLLGLPFAHVFQSLLGFRLAEYWIILWHFQCQFYTGMCKRSISHEHDSYLFILIKIVEFLLNVLGGRRFGRYWPWMTVLGSLLQTLLIGLFLWFLRLGLYRS